MKMVKLYYCTNCRKIQDNETSCAACESDKIKELKKGTSVNVIGTKTKGKIYRIKQEQVDLIIVHPESKETTIKGFKPEEIRKVL